MKRAVMVLLAGAPAAQAYTHFGATDNVVLTRQWSEQLFPAGATVAILGRSDTFANSLAAGALAGSIGAPVLLDPPEHRSRQPHRRRAVDHDTCLAAEALLNG